jgi:diguanylate cyclase (GGDEF)-like protein
MPVPAHVSRKSRFATGVLALFAALGVVLAILAVQVYRTVGQLVEENRWVTHTYEVREQIGGTTGALRAAEAAQRAYFLGGHAARLADYYAALPRVDERLDRLDKLASDNANQIQAAQQLRTLTTSRRELMTKATAAFEAGGLEALRADPQFAKAREQDAALDVLTQRMLDLEDALLVQRQASTSKQAALTRLLTVSAIALCIGILGFALMLILREQSRRVRSEARVSASNAELSRSLEDSRRLADTLRQLSNLGEMLQSCRSLDEAAAGLQRTLESLLPGTSGAINLINASQNLLSPIGTWGRPIDGEALFAPDDCWALRRGRAYPEERAVSPFACRHLAIEGEEQLHSHLCVPLLAQGTMLGTLLLSADTPIGGETRDAALAASEQVSLAVSNLKLQETLRTQSLRDGLTGLFNRRYLEVSMARDLARAIRRSQPLAVLMIDVDHFKQFNDTHGHDAGDALLAQFGKCVLSLLRNEDVACRYGGEEFTILLQEADAAIALDRAEEIHRAVATLDVEHRRQKLGPVSVSIGIASYPQHGDSPEHLLHRADRALYTAKEQGRNRTCVADR